jgi:hypothetical protein
MNAHVLLKVTFGEGGRAGRLDVIFIEVFTQQECCHLQLI